MGKGAATGDFGLGRGGAVGASLTRVGGRGSAMADRLGTKTASFRIFRQAFSRFISKSGGPKLFFGGQMNLQFTVLQFTADNFS